MPLQGEYKKSATTIKDKNKSIEIYGKYCVEIGNAELKVVRKKNIVPEKSFKIFTTRKKLPKNVLL